jgi:hypothetical protein
LLALQRRPTPVEQRIRGRAVRVANVTAFGEDTVNHGAINPLQRELAAKRHLAAGLGPVPTLDPRLSERFVIEVPHLDQTIDDLVDERVRIPKVTETPTRLGDGA